MVCVRLTSRHCHDRREWATSHVNRRRNEWSNVLFSDESRFSVHTDNRRIFIWRDRGNLVENTVEVEDKSHKEEDNGESEDLAEDLQFESGVGIDALFHVTYMQKKIP
ncbi:transposable element Tcb2 transposase [Trichonephila clavipes]|nr:transposable element Tcb2 transposase [Trichonephila clavipes]